jgi:hypothetical protein
MSLAVLVPTRGRPDNALALYGAWESSIARADTSLVFIIDSDDPHRNTYYNVLKAFRNRLSILEFSDLESPPHARLGEVLNKAVGDLQADYIGFMGDDHRPRTYGWDRRVIAALADLGTGIVYGNDLIQGPNLPTAVFMTADIPALLGYFVPPALSHMYLDNFWRDLGNAIGRLRYLPEVVIEHMHPIAGKAEWDPGYMAVAGQMGPDAETYSRYFEQHFLDDVAKIDRKIRQR